MCDGVTQGRAGMELSLFSRDVIAMSTAVALSHGMFDAALLLGVCDKIVPGLFIGAMVSATCPRSSCLAGPMTSGLPNKEKSRGAQLYAEGKVGREELLDAEAPVLPRPRHLHLLRHGQQQPDADGSDGPAPAGRGVRQSRHAAARRAHRAATERRGASPRWASTAPHGRHR
jgi:hypothetical protein